MLELKIYLDFTYLKFFNQIKMKQSSQGEQYNRWLSILEWRHFPFVTQSQLVDFHWTLIYFPMIETYELTLITRNSMTMDKPRTFNYKTEMKWNKNVKIEIKVPLTRLEPATTITL